MKYKFAGLMMVLTLIMLAACASQPLPPPEWTYEPEAIKIHLKADPKLNFDEGVAHTLVVCLYQLKDPNAFNQLSQDMDGISNLLQCALFDTGVATAKRLIVNPGQSVDLTMDRAEGAKYVAVVAGYYTLEKDRMIRLYDIPVVVETKGWIKRTKLSKPGPLTIQLDLGPSQIKGKS